MKFVKCVAPDTDILKKNKIYMVESEGSVNYTLKGMKFEGDWWYKTRFEVLETNKIFRVLYEIG